MSVHNTIGDSSRNDAMLAAALEYAEHHWPVFPLRGKIPAIPKRIGGRGLLDATTDADQVAEWWTGRYAGCNIGGRVPASMFVLDTDPYKGGLESLGRLETDHEPLPETLTDYSGRGDGGTHTFWRRPPGKLTGTRLGPGIDLRTHNNYVVLPPAVHPTTGKPYVRIERPVATPPVWLITLLLPEPAQRRRPVSARSRRLLGPSIADAYSAAAGWADILGPHGWRCIDADPDADGARWLHPTATSACSATVRNGCLFVWSTNTVLDISEPGNPKGYTKFRAYALLNHGGDMKAAARSLRGAA
jgi:hypothetical protein